MSAPRGLMFRVARYVRAQSAPVSTAEVAAVMGISTELAGSALTTARGRGYVKRTASCWHAGEVKPMSAEDRQARFEVMLERKRRRQAAQASTIDGGWSGSSLTRD